MPLIGRVSGRHLDALLPEILSQANRPTPKRHYWWKGLQILSVITCMFGVLLMVPMVMQSAEADEQDSWSPNVPINTSTPTVEEQQQQQAAVPEETEEPTGCAFCCDRSGERQRNY